jgi:hypothetical protein
MDQSPQHISKHGTTATTDDDATSVDVRNIWAHTGISGDLWLTIEDESGSSFAVHVPVEKVPVLRDALGPHSWADRVAEDRRLLDDLAESVADAKAGVKYPTRAVTL